MRVLRWFVVTLLFIAILALAFGVWTVRRSFPKTDGEVELAGLSQPVTVVRDDGGVPHITASTTDDLFMAQGYVHAQDRFWQMDTWRHIGAGRLSEMFGEGQVETDIFLRTLGFERIARQEYEAMPPETRAALDAYAAGVNAYLAERPGGARLSLEYAVLGLQNGDYEPEPWTPEHTLTWAHVMAWDLRSNLESEIDRALLVEAVGEARAEDLYPPHPRSHPPIVSSGDPTAGATPPADRLPAASAPALDRARANVSRVTAVLGRPFEGLGSNNWVVAGDHTESGMPLLANDPHLGIQLPSIWYETALWCEEVGPDCPFRVTGFSFPGAPGVVLGHNERIAWGVTNEGPDTMDLFLERTDGDRYEVDGEWVPFETRTEIIEVAGGDDVEVEVRSSRHGPIISGSYAPIDGLPSGGDPEFEVALSWQALEPATLFQALLGINAASDWDEFRRAASLFDIAPQNLVYADVDGHIGYQATGEIPIRRRGDGRYPVPGWNSEHEWEGLIPFDELPSLFDPASGIIVTANQPLVDGSYPHFIGADHDYGYRGHRITELLAADDSLAVADMTAIQMDNYDASAAFIVPAVMDVESDDADLIAVQDVLGRWAGVSEPFQMDPESPGAAAYAAVWRHLLALTFDELPADLAPPGSSRYFEVVRLLVEDPANPWWDDASTDATETAADIIEAAARAAHEELTETLGADPRDWKWRDLHTASFENQTLGQSGIGPIEALFNRRVADVGGGSSIVNATSWIASEGYEVRAVPSMRMVIDLADFGASTAIHTTGQSGHAFHSNYFDMADEWARGTSRRLPFEPPAEGARLALVPAG